MYQIAASRPHGHKIYQHLPLQDPPRVARFGIFGLKIYRLATLVQLRVIFLLLLSLFTSLISVCRASIAMVNIETSRSEITSVRQNKVFFCCAFFFHFLLATFSLRFFLRLRRFLWNFRFLVCYAFCACFIATFKLVKGIF
jgi:hypothetical protein